MDRDELEAMQLGELPAGAARERREVYTDRRDAPLYGQPGARVDVPHIIDVRRANEAAAAAQRAPAARFHADYVVQTTFDARPINGADWRAEDLLVLAPGNGTAPVNHDFLTFIVPSGRVAILRRVSWEVVADVLVPQTVSYNTPRPRLAESQPMWVSVSVGGSVLFTYDQMFGQAGDEDLYAIAGEREQIVVGVHKNLDVAPDAWSPNILVRMYGNLLDVNGRQKNFAPANRYDGSILK